MKKIPKPEYTAEFKVLAVKRVKDGLTIGAAARELGFGVKGGSFEFFYRGCR